MLISATAAILSKPEMKDMLAHQMLTVTLSKSPQDFSELVQKETREWGEFIRENTPVATIVQLNPLKLKTAIQEKHAGLIRPGQTVAFAVEAFPGRAFAGTVAYVGPSVDQATRTFAVEALVESEEGGAIVMRHLLLLDDLAA